MDMEITCVDLIYSLCNGVPYDCGGSICGFGSQSYCSWTYSGGGSTGGDGSNDGDSDNNNETGGSGTKIPRNDDDSSDVVDNGDAIVVPVPPSYEDYFDKYVFIDQDFKDKPCLKAVYNAMGKATKFKEYLQNFEATASVADLRFTADNNFGNTEPSKYHNAMAITKPPLTNNEVKIKFNTDTNTTGNILNKPDVYKAVSMIHEIIHAEMYRKMLDAMIVAQGAGTTLDWTDLTYDEFNQYLDTLQNKYFGIWDYYVRYDNNDDTPDNGQHQQMAQHYRDIVKQALTDYDPTLTSQQKEALSWIGLNEANVVAWQNYPNKSSVTNTLTNIKNTFPNGCN
jgi:hypothetical protein